MIWRSLSFLLSWTAINKTTGFNDRQIKCSISPTDKNQNLFLCWYSLINTRNHWCFRGDLYPPAVLHNFHSGEKKRSSFSLFNVWKFCRQCESFLFYFHTVFLIIIMTKYSGKDICIQLLYLKLGHVPPRYNWNIVESGIKHHTF